MVRFLSISTLFMTLLFFTGCGIIEETTQRASQAGADLMKTGQETVQATEQTIQKVEKKIQQGQEVLDAVGETKKKIDAFQSE